mgnify:CR=1 FL=1
MALKWLRDNLRHLKFILWGVVLVFVLLVFVDWGAGRAGGGERVAPAGSDRGNPVVGLDHVAASRDHQDALGIAHQEHRLEPTHPALGIVARQRGEVDQRDGAQEPGGLERLPRLPERPPRRSRHRGPHPSALRCPGW